LFVLRNHLRWNELPSETRCGSGENYWRQLWRWQQPSVWAHLPVLLLSRLRAADRIDLSSVIVESSSIRAVEAGHEQVGTPLIVRDYAPK
jgi:hypothetical protein